MTKKKDVPLALNLKRRWFSSIKVAKHERISFKNMI